VCPLCSLQPQLNGIAAVVERYTPERGLYEIRAEHGCKKFALKRANLSVVPGVLGRLDGAIWRAVVLPFFSIPVALKAACVYVSVNPPSYGTVVRTRERTGHVCDTCLTLVVRLFVAGVRLLLRRTRRRTAQCRSLIH
jgi:hypothetical protein